MTLTMRWVLFICLFTAVYLAAAGMHTGANMLELAPTITSFLMFGIGGESFSSWMENRK
jgi:hypothetical protein